MYRFFRFVNTSIPSCIDIHKFHPNAPLPPRGTKARMASPVLNTIHAWNGLVTVSPRLVDSCPPNALRICTGLGKPFPPSFTLFLSAAGVGALLPRTVRHRMRQPKEKPPMALVGLTLGVGQFWNQYAHRMGSIYPFQNHTSPPKTSGVGSCFALFQRLPHRQHFQFCPKISGSVNPHTKKPQNIGKSPRK